MTEELSIEQLENAEKMGFKLFGDIFKDTPTYIQIQRKKKEVQESAEALIEQEKAEYEVECAAAQSLTQAEDEARWQEEQEADNKQWYDDYAEGHEDDEEP